MPNINIVVVTAKMIFLLDNIKNLIKKVSILLDNKYKHLKLAIWGVLGVDVPGNAQLNFIILTFKFWQV